MRNLNKSKIGMNIYVRAFSRDARNHDLATLTYETTPSCSFYAKKINADMSDDAVINNTFKFKRVSTIIKTFDLGFEQVDSDDILVFDGIKWIVESVQQVEDVKTSVYGRKNISYTTYIALKR